MKKVILINGSPRKNGNTAALLEHALEGAVSAGASAELIHLFDLRFSGCLSCFSCKRKDIEQPSACAIRDGLSPVLDKITGCDALIIGSPIYIHDVTGAVRNLIERLYFMNRSYDSSDEHLFKGRVDSAFFFTMNTPEKNSDKYKALFESTSGLLGILEGSTQYLASYDTYQFDDYSKYHAARFDEAHKAEHRARQFPVDCRRAYEIGAALGSDQSTSCAAAQASRGTL